MLGSKSYGTRVQIRSCQPPEAELGEAEGGEGGERRGEYLLILSEAAAAEPGEGPLYDPASRQDHEAFHAA